MKKNFIILLVLLGVIPAISLAQDSTPKKGYYSITGKNSQRSAVTNPVQLSEQPAAYPTVTKGYYSMAGHNKKLPRETRIYLPSAKLESPKGYYSMPAATDSLIRKK